MLTSTGSVIRPNALSKATQVATDEALLLFCVMNDVAFHDVNSPAFVMLIQLMNPNYTTPPGAILQLMPVCYHLIVAWYSWLYSVLTCAMWALCRPRCPGAHTSAS